MSDTYQFSQRIQRTIVAMLLYDSANLTFLSRVIDPAHFENEICGVIASLILKFFGAYGRAPPRTRCFRLKTLTWS